MTAALEPELAAAYVHELSADVSAVVVLDADREAASPGRRHLAAARALRSSPPVP